jgi:hypothetical protein
LNLTVGAFVDSLAEVAQWHVKRAYLLGRVKQVIEEVMRKTLPVSGTPLKHRGGSLVCELAVSQQCTRIQSHRGLKLNTWSEHNMKQAAEEWK